MLQNLKKLYFNNIHVIVTICVQELNTYFTVKTTWKFWSCHKNTQVINYYGDPLSCWKRGKGEIVEWPVNRCPLRKVRIGRGKERRWNHKVALLFRSTQLPFPHGVIAFLCTYNLHIYIIYLYINTQCMYKY